MVFILTRVVYSHHSCYIAIFHPYKQVFTPPDWEFNQKYRCSQPKQWKFSRFSLSNWDILGISTKNPKKTLIFLPNVNFLGKLAQILPKWPISPIWSGTEKVRILVRISTGLYGQNTGFVRVDLAVRKKYVFFTY